MNVKQVLFLTLMPIVKDFLVRILKIESYYAGNDTQLIVQD